MQIVCTILLARVEQAEARFDQALALFEDAKQLATKGDDKNHAVECLIYIGEIHAKVDFILFYTS